MPRHEEWMQRAIRIAQQGQGAVEPNPMVGCVLTLEDQVIGEGYHERFGQAHAEVNALASVSDAMRTRLSEATAYITLEPCSHFGKTPPCADALIQAGVRDAFVAVEDPNPAVSGKGIQRLREAGIEVQTGLLESEAVELLKPYLKRLKTGLPWVIAKWAMTIDGKIATASGDSKWISGMGSRQQVHQLRARVDAVVVGIGTVIADDPMLNARLENQKPLREATRVVFDATARVPISSQLVQTAHDHPTLIVVGKDASESVCDQLEQMGCQVFRGTDRDRLPDEAFRFLAANGATNVMVEGGAGLLGSLNDQNMIDELHIYVGNRLIGDAAALGPISGEGCPRLQDASRFAIHRFERIDDDILIVYRRQEDGGSR